MKSMLFIPLVGLSLVFGFFVFLQSPGMFKYFSSPFIVGAATCETSYKVLDLVPGNYRSPIRGSEEDSKVFQGHSVFRYLYPNCPHLNTDNLPKLFEFKRDGRLSIAGNLVIGGHSTSFITSSSVGFQAGSDIKVDIPSMSFFSESSNTHIAGRVNLYPGESKGVSQGYETFGPSIYLNEEFSRIKFADVLSIGPNYEQGIIETNFLENNPRIIKHMTQSFFKFNPVDFQKMDDYFYVADKGGRQIVRYDPVSGDLVALGRDNWFWTPAGLSVSETEEGEENVYVTDPLKNRIIRTKMDGSDWNDTTDAKEDYFVKLLITGEENVSYDYYEVSDTGTTSEANFFADGYTRHEVIAKDHDYLNYDSSQGIFDFTDEVDRIFGDSSLKLDGEKIFTIKNHPDFNFGKDSFVFDFWLRFASLDHDQILFNRPGSYMLEFINSDGSPRLVFTTVHKEDESEEGDFVETEEFAVSRSWDPDPFTWYNIAVVSDHSHPDTSRFNIYVDGERLTDESVGDNPINKWELTPLVNSGGNLLIGNDTYYQQGFRGNIDHFRVLRGNGYITQHFDMEAPKYYFKNPLGLVEAEDYLYIVDNENDRIVKILKQFSSTEHIALSYWDTFGFSGSGNYQFDDPTNIYYKQLETESDGYFYIIDAGNERIVKTDIAVTSDRFKNFDFSAASWEVLDLSNFYELLSPELSHKYGSKKFFQEYFEEYTSGTIVRDLSPYLINTPYENGEVKLAIRGSGSFNVHLMDDMLGSETFRLTEHFSGGFNILTFQLPEGFLLDEAGGSLYLHIEEGGQVKFIKALLSKSFSVGGLDIKENGNLYITDKYNGSIIKCEGGAINMSCNNMEIMGRQNPQEKESNNLNELEYHDYLLRLVSPRGIYVDYDDEEEPMYFILDGLSEHDMAITSGQEGDMVWTHE